MLHCCRTFFFCMTFSTKNLNFCSVPLFALKKTCTVLLYLVLGHLSGKVPQPGDSEEICSVFESTCHLLLPVQPLKLRHGQVPCYKDTTRELSGFFSACTNPYSIC